MAYKHVIKVSNICQIVDKSQLITEQRNTVSFTNNGDGSISLTGAATDYEWVPITQISNRKIIKGHIYLLGGNSYKNSLVAMYGRCIFSTGNKDFGYFSYNNEWVRFISAYTGYFQIMLQMRDVILDNFKITPQLFDLTDMYGAGHEPATVAEFREKFPNDYYPYTPYNYLQSNKRMIKVSDVCQLYAKNIWKEYTDLYGVSIKNNNDGSITLNGTATQTFYYTNRLDYEIKPNHKYLYVDYYPQTPSWDTYIGGCEGKVNHESAVKFAIYNLNNDGTIDPSSPNLPSNTLLNTFCMCYKGFTFNNITIKPQLFDLTEMFGAGHEPATVAEFRQRFPNEYYPYSPQCWLTSYKSAVVCKTKNLFDVNKITESTNLKNNKDGTITVSVYGVSGGLLKNLCPELKVGDVIKVYFQPLRWTATKPPLVMVVGDVIFDRNGNSKLTVTERSLNKPVWFYNNDYDERGLPGTTIIGNILITTDLTITNKNHNERYTPYQHL